MPLTHDPTAALRDKNPDWDIFRTPLGRWWAINWTTTRMQLHRGCVATLDADSPHALAGLLAEQAHRRDEVTA